MYRFSLVLIVLTACGSKDALNRVCPSECYGDWNPDNYYVDQETGGVGQCKVGKPVCDENFTVIECQGEVLPRTEVCDGADNDCDGKTDEGWDNEPLVAYGEEDTCGNFGECARYNAVCEGGQYVCPYQPQPEICDNKDNNCNAVVDEDLGNDQLCFDDEFWKVTNGECRAGVMRCIEGNMRCDGQVLPSIERCDNEDNDCNGIVDDTGDVLSSKYDIVFIVDTSGSMCGYIEAVAAALYQYLDQFAANDNFRWALMGMSSEFGELVQVLVDFTDMATVQTALGSLGCYGESNEASLDALYQACSHLDASDINLSWRDDANALVFSFTDEPAQTYSTPPTDGLMITDACLNHGVLPFQWSFSPSDFRPIVEPANGIHFMMSDDWQTIFDDLNSIVITLCGA